MKMLFAWFLVVQSLLLVQSTPLGEEERLLCLFPKTPNQLRVAFRGSNGVTVSWRTGGYLNGSNDTPYPQVSYSTSSLLLGAVPSSVGTSSTYNPTSFFHNVGLVGLLPSTTYYYQIEASSPCVLQSATYSFTTARAAGNLNPINISLVADLGNDNVVNGGAASLTMQALLQAAQNTNFFIHSGDISYADDYGLLVPFSFYEQTWNTWQDDMTDLTANNIYMTAPGNHEVTCFQEGDVFCVGPFSNYRNFSAYLNRFRMPGDESGGYKNMWYSFDYGMVHVVVINTETDFHNAPSGPNTTLNGGNFEGLTQQLAWFEADLQAANASRDEVPWIIVTGHRPFYSSLPAIPATAGNCSACAAAFEPLILKYNVDFYFCGHVHWYERLYPVDANGNLVATNYNNQPGYIHVTNGAGGAAEGKGTLSGAPINASAAIVSAYGYTRLELIDASHARLSFIDSSTMAEADFVNITRNH